MPAMVSIVQVSGLCCQKVMLYVGMEKGNGA